MAYGSSGFTLAHDASTRKAPAHGRTIVTRNVDHFAATGVALLEPWGACWLDRSGLRLGCGTWIRSKAGRSTAGSSTAKLSPNGSAGGANTTPRPAPATGR